MPSQPCRQLYICLQPWKAPGGVTESPENTTTQLTWLHPGDLVVPLSAEYFNNTCKTECVQVHQIKKTRDEEYGAVFWASAFPEKAAFYAETLSIISYMGFVAPTCHHIDRSVVLYIATQTNTHATGGIEYAWCLAVGEVDRRILSAAEVWIKIWHCTPLHYHEKGVFYRDERKTSYKVNND